MVFQIVNIHKKNYYFLRIPVLPFLRKMEYNRNALEDESNDGRSSKRFRQVQIENGVQIRRTQAKKCFPEWSGSTFLRISVTKGINFFFLCPRPFRRSAFPVIPTCHWGRNGKKGNVLRGWVVLNMILPYTLMVFNSEKCKESRCYFLHLKCQVYLICPRVFYDELSCW